MNQLKILGLNGPKQCGKDTVGKILTEEFDGVTLDSFAGPIRRMLLALGVPYRNLHEDKEVPMPEFGGKSGRQLMQSLGTEWGKTLVHPLLWARRPFNAARTGGTKWLVITDLRFGDEYGVIRQHGGFVWTITNPRVAYSYEHRSEMPLPPDCPPDAIISNDRDLDALRVQVIAVAKQLGMTRSPHLF